MDPRSATYIAEATGGQLLGAGDALVTRVCTDSRIVQPGDLFIALKGDKFDAHDFLPDVIRRSPAALLVRAGYPTTAVECPVIEVDDTRQALWRLALRYRADFELPVIAVAGSNGKTTTKEIVHSVLRQKFPTVRSPASFNNDIGVPLSILQLGNEHKAAVFEAGTNHPGELAPLLKLMAPRYSILTSIGREHLEHFGSVEEVAREEGWAAELLPKDGKLFINGDTPLAIGITKRTGAEVVTVGIAEANQWRVTSTQVTSTGTAFKLENVAGDFSGSYHVPLFGAHQAVNAALAIAVGVEFGLTRPEIERGLAACPQPAMRMQVWETRGVRVLDDSYNANTDSMIAALQTLRAFPCQGRRVAVLGDMAEQGSQSEHAHLEVGRVAAQLGIDQLIAIGPLAVSIAKGARQAGLHRVLEFAQVESAAGAVRSYIKTGDALLIKASRAMGLERVAEALRDPGT
jgi:UDP-N-acetylmuramoyl-tripeptide--D-alanyl-D-alanine ligase